MFYVFYWWVDLHDETLKRVQHDSVVVKEINRRVFDTKGYHLPLKLTIYLYDEVRNVCLSIGLGQRGNSSSVLNESEHVRCNIFRFLMQRGLW